MRRHASGDTQLGGPLGRFSGKHGWSGVKLQRRARFPACCTCKTEKGLEPLWGGWWWLLGHKSFVLADDDVSWQRVHESERKGCWASIRRSRESDPDWHIYNPLNLAPTQGRETLGCLVLWEVNFSVSSFKQEVIHYKVVLPKDSKEKRGVSFLEWWLGQCVHKGDCGADTDPV